MSHVQDLKSRWEALNVEVGEDISKRWWKTIEENYSESSRHYHTLDHIADMFKHYENCRSKLNSPTMVAYAIFFHDLVYDAKSSGQNEKESAAMFQKFAKEAGLFENSDAYKDVERLISLTATHLTEEHCVAGDSYGTEDAHYFLDFDMAILGSSSNDYDDYAAKIKDEYSFLPAKSYNDLRAKVLRSFLQIPKIFVTEEFHKKYEAQARSNIQREIEQLKTMTE